MGLALGVDGVGKSKVAVAEHAAHVLRPGGHLPGRGEELLLRGREDVGGAAADLVQGTAVSLQPGLSDVEEVQPVLVDGHDLRRGKRHGAG